MINHIRQLRFEKGEMTQKELGEQVGVSRQTINGIERGKHTPSVEIAMRIAAVFELMVEDVFCTETEDDDGDTMTIRFVFDERPLPALEARPALPASLPVQSAVVTRARNR